MFYFIGENLWLNVASLASMQSLKSTGFDKGKLSFNFMAFLNNLKIVLLANDDLVDVVKNCGYFPKFELFLGLAV